MFSLCGITKLSITIPSPFFHLLIFYFCFLFPKNILKALCIHTWENCLITLVRQSCSSKMQCNLGIAGIQWCVHTAMSMFYLGWLSWGVEKETKYTGCSHVYMYIARVSGLWCSSLLTHTFHPFIPFLPTLLGSTCLNTQAMSYHFLLYLCFTCVLCILNNECMTYAWARFSLVPNFGAFGWKHCLRDVLLLYMHNNLLEQCKHPPVVNR